MEAPVSFDKASVVRADWYRSLSKYEKPDVKKAVGQLLDTMLPFFGLWALMIWMINQGYSYWLLLPPLVLASGLLVRIFIFFHDCGHGSFLPSKKWNTFLGYLTGIITYTPYEEWRLSHAEHHASVGNLDERGHGDIWTLTIDEYKSAPWYTKVAFRVYRNPFVMFIIGPLVMFMILQRFASKNAQPRERRSVYITNVALVALWVTMHYTIGLKTYLMIQVPIMMISGTLGVWLFYIQHQYEDVYWQRHDEWDPIKAALEGSSYYKLPGWLQWFTGNIGLHHIHHLRPRIPNYTLQQVFDEVPELQNIEPISIWKSFKSLFLHLWDEKKQELVGFRALKTQTE